MNDHSEFPWGPQYEPGLLTPLGIIGWAIASALLLLLLLRSGSGFASKASDTHLQDMHKVILAAARYALKQDEYGILQGGKVLRRTINYYLGGLLMGGGPISKQVKALATAMGEKDDKDAHGKGGHGKGGHGKDAHGKAAHGAHGAHAGNHGGAPEHAHAAAPGVAAHTVQGHSITVNVGGEGGHHGEDHEDEDKPLTLDEQLAACRKAVRDFEAWWSDKHARIAELKAAQEALTIPKKPDPAIIALLEETKNK